MEGKNIVRVEKNKDYTIINNTSIQDKRLSWKAKAIHVFMLSKPDDWTFYNEEIQKWAKDGKDSFLAGLKELQRFGYVKKERRRIEGGKFDYVTIVYEVPCMVSPHTENPLPDTPYAGKPSMDKPLTENPQLLSTYTLSTDSLSTNKQNNNDDDSKTPAYANTQLKQKPPNAFEFYERNNFGLLAHHITLKIDAWIYDMSEPLVIRAMEKAVENGICTWNYVETILKGWWNKRITTIDAVEAEDKRWKATQQRKQTKPQSSYKRGREEMVPEWFHNRSNDVTQPAPIENPPEQAIDFEAQRLKVLAKLQGGQAQ
ncbi:DnaD domain protein [Lysinibacillus fusiformis]|nr:DnaD domain protein [Lysinibacillus fusiformis]